jgi:hypothetical protein
LLDEKTAVLAERNSPVPAFKDAAAQLLVALTVTWQAGRLGVNIAKSCQARRATCLRQRHFINLMS